MRLSVAAPAYLERLNLVALLNLAANPEQEGLAARALSHAVDELLEIEIEHRLTRGHDNAGYHSASPIAFLGLGGRDGPRMPSDQVTRAAIRQRGANAWRGLALDLLRPLNEAGRRAALVSAYVVRPTRAARRSPRMMTSAEACDSERLAEIYHRLGWPPQSEPRFVSPDALRNAASRARKVMGQSLAGRLEAAVALGEDPGSIRHV